jgi:hypothetical protein
MSSIDDRIRGLNHRTVAIVCLVNGEKSARQARAAPRSIRILDEAQRAGRSSTVSVGSKARLCAG